jgi:demethylmenaquinone methyltransferase/2-methoxy-6-polyprenyl-1,4-benzoquinol methylase
MRYDVEKINPYNDEQSKKEQIEQLFDKIAPDYDKLNSVLSLGIDKYWRKEAIKTLRKYRPETILDIATGTGDFAFLAQKILKPKHVFGIDISEEMLNIGKQKAQQQGLQQRITFEKQDCSALSFPHNSFDAATVAFGVRNFENINKSFQEILRVLKPGGIFLFLELSTPEKKPIKQIYNAYTERVMPAIASLLADKRRAFKYLHKSIVAFPQGREMMLILKENGFEKIRLRRFTLGSCTLYMGEKPLQMSIDM